MTTQPNPILPWHRTVGVFAADRARAGAAFLVTSESFAELVAEHDPHAAQHAETVRLLKMALRKHDISEDIRWKQLGLPRPENRVGEAEHWKEIAAHLDNIKGETP